jgi:hypothetical protein
MDDLLVANIEVELDFQVLLQNHNKPCFAAIPTYVFLKLYFPPTLGSAALQTLSDEVLIQFRRPPYFSFEHLNLLKFGSLDFDNFIASHNLCFIFCGQGVVFNAKNLLLFYVELFELFDSAH